jgi:hypothetical protein
LTGGCSCGDVRYEVATFPLMVYTCSCANCQTASGSAFALNMPVQTNGFRITKGDLKDWRHLSPTGVPVVSWFCGECGARIYGERSTRPDSINLRAGTLDDTKWLIPVAHIFRRSAQGWVQPAPGAACHETQPDDFHLLAKKWRATWHEFFPKK